MVRKCENVTQAIQAVHPIPSLSDVMNRNASSCYEISI